MKTVKMVMKNDAESRFDLQPGEVQEYQRKPGEFGLIISCPQCGYPASGTHIWNKATQTLTPSLVCGAEGCDYHGHLKNGIFDSVKE